MRIDEAEASRCRLRTALVVAVVSMGAALTYAAVGQAKPYRQMSAPCQGSSCLPPEPLDLAPVPLEPGPVSASEWAGEQRFKDKLMYAFSALYRVEPGWERVCTQERGKSDAFQVFAEALHSVVVNLDRDAQFARDLGRWGRGLVDHATPKNYPHAGQRARVVSASGDIRKGAAQLSRAFKDLRDAYAGISTLSCTQTGAMARAASAHAAAAPRLARGFSELPH